MSSTFEQWERAKPHLERSLAYSGGTHTIDDVCLMVGAGALKLLLGENCAMAVEIHQFPRMKVLNVFTAGADDMKELLKLESQLIDMAKELGCSRITEIGRKGWLEVLPGAKALGTALYRDI